MEISTLIDTGKDALSKAAGIVADNPLATAVVAGGAGVAVGTGVGLAVSNVSKVRKKRKKKYVKKKKSSRRRTRRTRRTRRRRGRRTPYTAGKGKDRSTKRIRYTKNGQPYVILSSGKARFIKQSSARKSHRRKGGRY